MKTIALILSGGVGTRLGEKIPKQYIEVEGRPIFAYCLEQLCRHTDIDAIQIVADAAWTDLIREQLGRFDEKGKFRGFSEPGENRQGSILHGLEDIRQYAGERDAVLIHDAARPLLTEKQISECVRALAGVDGVIPVLPMKDTVYRSLDGKRIDSLVRREELYAGQAPEVFVLGAYLLANRSLLPDKIKEINGSTEPAVLAGLDVAMIPGDEKNFKITTKEDLKRFQDMVRMQKG